jgi:UDP-GlcNAc:undecaprenyl-phosphate GlcNAc-1-phosphate transferase
MKILIAASLGFLLTLITLPLFLRLLQEAGATRPNYRGESIPVGMGLIFVFVYILVAFLLAYWAAGDLVLLVLFLVGVVFFALLGLLDDLLGSRENRGLKGHFGALLNGKLTTGALKALGGGAGALLISFISLPGRPWWEILTAALLMALAANTINLVDLRPGRAIKVFYLWFLILLAVFQDKLPLVLIAPLAGGLLACAPADLKARAMLGDTGANLLGAALGMASVWTMTFPAQLAVVAFLMLLHLFTERYSLTMIIEKNRLLRFLDNLGRSK